MRLVLVLIRFWCSYSITGQTGQTGFAIQLKLAEASLLTVVPNCICHEIFASVAYRPLQLVSNKKYHK